MALCKLPVCAFGGRTAALVLMGRLAMGGSAKKTGRDKTRGWRDRSFRSTSLTLDVLE